jgi:flagellin
MADGVVRNLAAQYDGLSTAVRRLSSGLRVNTAADDAAGLAIRELMRADIATLNQGVRNANDAISLIQTADGALQIVDEKLIRMKELAEQAATGTYNSVQRLMIDSEYQAMAREITRIGRATEFNGIKLLDGNLEGVHDGSGMGYRNGPPGSVDNLLFGGMLKIHFGTGNNPAEDYYYIRIFDTTNMYLNLGDEFSLESMAPAEMTRPFLMGIELNLKHRVISGRPLTQKEIDAGYYITQEEYDAAFQASRAASEAFMREAVYGFDSAASFMAAFNETFGASTVPRDTSFTGPEGLTHAYLDGMDTADYAAIYAAYNALTGDEKEKYQLAFMRNSIKNLGDRLRSGSIFTDPGANPGGTDFFAAVDEKLWDDIAWSGTYAVNQFLHLHTYAGRNIRTQENGQHALGAVDRAMLKKDSNRANLGALQNRLENTVSNLQIQAENLQAAESRISDADVPREMREFVRGQILTSAATAMLAQANSLPRILMSLLG